MYIYVCIYPPEDTILTMFLVFLRFVAWYYTFCCCYYHVYTIPVCSVYIASSVISRRTYKTITLAHSSTPVDKPAPALLELRHHFKTFSSFSCPVFESILKLCFNKFNFVPKTS